MKPEVLALIAALAAIGVAVYAVTRKPPQQVIYQAPRRTDLEAGLTGVGNLLEGAGSLAGSILQPRIGMASSSSGG